MKLHDTLSKKLQEVKPLHGQKVTFYSCGPTVYDYPHIGNWYTFIRYDMVVRALRASGFDVDWVMNITDVGHLVSDADDGEDKLEKGARREGQTAWEVAKKYADYFEQGLERLNINEPSKLPRATDHIKDQIQLIQTLEDRGYTYVIDDGVYFDTSKFKSYGKLGNIDLEGLQAGARVAENSQKRQSYDFALWKFSPKNEKRDMEWDSPWGKGFPGWHLECSAMSMKYLGETLDIHGGGIDHIPTHHNGEIAQSEAATGKTFANIWFHSNFNLVDGQKMSKSLGNFYTLEDIEKKGYDLMAFRLLVLQSHYRTEAHFTWENLEAAQNRLKKWQAVADLRWQLDKSISLKPDTMLAALQNDLDTPSALKVADIYFGQLETSNTSPDEATLKEFNEVLGIDLMKDDIDESAKELLKKRKEARDNKDWTKSDELREKLKDQGIEINDTAHGQLWSRV